MPGRNQERGPNRFNIVKCIDTELEKEKLMLRWNDISDTKKHDIAVRLIDNGSIESLKRKTPDQIIVVFNEENPIITINWRNEGRSFSNGSFINRYQEKKLSNLAYMALCRRTIRPEVALHLQVNHGTPRWWGPRPTTEQRSRLLA